MNADFIIDENANFYYWLQVISDWDPGTIDRDTYEYYKSALAPLNADQKAALETIKKTLQESEQPSRVLAKLYADDSNSPESKIIQDHSVNFRRNFASVWEQGLPFLEKWQQILRAEDLKKFSEPMLHIIDFLDSSYDAKSVLKVYLLQNPPSMHSVGHAINETGFILLRPAGSGDESALSNAVATLAHEYIHAIEFNSRITRGLFKKSYDSIVNVHNLPDPNGYSWKMMYVEAIVYCFASKTIGGYLRPEIYQKPRPTLEEMESGFQKLVNGGRYNTGDVINWAALNILPDVEHYVGASKKIDKQIVDTLSKVFTDFYLTNNKK